MDEQEIKTLIQQELPKIIQNREIRDFVLQTVTNYFAGKQETESRFDQVLAELRRDSEEQARKWDEKSRKWDEQNQKWWENQQRQHRMEQQIDQSLQEVKKTQS